MMDQPGMAYVQPPPAGYADVPQNGYAYPAPDQDAGVMPQSAPPLAAAPQQAPASFEQQYVPPPADQQLAPPPAQQEQLPPPPMTQQPVPPPSEAQLPAAPPVVETPNAATEPQVADAAAPPATGAAQPKPEDQAKIEEEFGQRMEEGAAAFAVGDFDKARHAFVLAILAIPDSVDAKLAYAITQFAMGDYHVAAILLRQVIPAHPDVVYADFDLRERYEKKDKLGQQIEALRAFIKAHPKDVEPMLVLGFVQHFSDQRDQARRTFAEASKLAPKEAVASIFLNPPPAPVATTQPFPQPAATVTAPTAVPTTQPVTAGQLPIGNE